MRTIKLRSGQSLWDIALQELGNIEAAYDIAVLNDVSIADDVAAGTQLVIPETPKDPDMLNYYKKNNIQPATN